MRAGGCAWMIDEQKTPTIVNTLAARANWPVMRFILRTSCVVPGGPRAQKFAR
jgi:hypothetical protein